MRWTYRSQWAPVLTIASALLAAPSAVPQAPAAQPTLSKMNQEMIHQMLVDAYNTLKDHYYDPSMGGIDWQARFKNHDAHIAAAHDLGDGFRVIASFLQGLNDSHTYFMPPSRPMRFDTGYRMSIVGNDCYVTAVRPHTDAENKLHVGDEIQHFDGYAVNRQDFEDITYFFHVLSPQQVAQMDLLAPDGTTRRALITADVVPTKKLLDVSDPGSADYWDLLRRDEEEDHQSHPRPVEVGDVTIMKLEGFDLDRSDVDRYMDIARKHSALVLDLRGNGGGSIDTLEWLLGSFFNHPVKIADRVGRHNPKPLVARPYGRTYDGKLIVLVDTGSASASELFARVIQLEHRGTVIGDKTAGAVMEATFYPVHQGTDTQIEYAFSITDANLIMTDGNSLEKKGVTPDEILLPTGADLAAGRDPVLSHAAELAGAKLDPAAAGKLFPYQWPRL
jgi:carboxyl-terminal processing protease